MSRRQNQSDATSETNISEDDLNHSIEQIWRDLDGRIPQARIRQVAVEVAAGFHDATATAHIPLYIRHLAREWLKANLVIDQ